MSEESLKKRLLALPCISKFFKKDMGCHEIRLFARAYMNKQLFELDPFVTILEAHLKLEADLKNAMDEKYKLLLQIQEEELGIKQSIDSYDIRDLRRMIYSSI